jgi:hypothetical protein
MSWKPVHVAVLSCLLAAALAAEPVQESERGLFVVSFQSQLDPLQINVLHSWIVHIENVDGDGVVGATITATGGMPLHDHGLPTRPRIVAELGDGDYLLDGMRFHMAGMWEISLTIVAGGQTDTAVIAITL